MKPSTRTQPRVPMTQEALARMQRGAASAQGGGVEKGSHVARLQRQLAIDQNRKGAR
ncbi:hypothetical protein [Paracidovorax konjaci]|uniref:Uncharacterized protein n=1 Tax=Paracidovorax konjaci TaxID=32040 RepID=A0A1I1WQ42_9BURK|nr:hypothetical protein [Paracidovorax konjaci]SFD95543.1 hypothetical protein SAMN04489710_11019 [Paracidovorax konjaci]